MKVGLKVAPGRGESNGAGATLRHDGLKVSLRYADEEFVGMPTTTAILEIGKAARDGLHNSLEMFGGKNRTVRVSSTNTLAFQESSEIHFRRPRESSALLEVLARFAEPFILHLNSGGAA